MSKEGWRKTKTHCQVDNMIKVSYKERITRLLDAYKEGEQDAKDINSNHKNWKGYSDKTGKEVHNFMNKGCR